MRDCIITVLVIPCCINNRDGLSIEIYFQLSKISSFYINKRHPTVCMPVWYSSVMMVTVFLEFCDIVGPRSSCTLQPDLANDCDPVNVSSHPFPVFFKKFRL